MSDQTYKICTYVVNITLILLFGIFVYGVIVGHYL